MLSFVKGLHPMAQLSSLQPPLNIPVGQDAYLLVTILLLNHHTGLGFHHCLKSV